MIDSIYIELINLFKNCRNILIDDTLSSSSPDLYDALYSNLNSEIYKIKIELYEIEWLELHWKKIIETIKLNDHSETEKKELLSITAKLYTNFINDWNYKRSDPIIFEKIKNILKNLISINNEWEKNLKRMNVSFEKSKKILNNRIEELKKEK